MRPFSNALRGAAIVTALAGLAGCSEYLERGNNVAFVGGNAVNTNKVTQMVDPWPPVSANRNIAYDGEKMATSVNRYRTGRVIPPRGTGTSGTYEPPPAAAPTPTPVGPSVTQPAAPVK